MERRFHNCRCVLSVGAMVGLLCRLNAEWSAVLADKLDTTGVYKKYNNYSKHFRSRCVFLSEMPQPLVMRPEQLA
jgi:hypothetical protein